MSALLPCPHCGRRPVQEFRYGGEESSRRLSARDEGPSLAAVLYDSDNPKGPAAEWWQHAAGCRAWFVLVRDTACDSVVEQRP